MSSDESNKRGLPDGREAAADTPVPSRRRLVKVGLYAAPVLLALKGRSALGQTCQSPYAFFSGNVSRSADATSCTPGFKPECYTNCATSGLWTAAGLEFPSFKNCSGSPIPVKCDEFNKSNESPVSKLSSEYHLSDALLDKLKIDCTNGGTFIDYGQGNNQPGRWGTTFGSIFGGSTSDLEKSPMWLILFKPDAYDEGPLAAQVIAALINAWTVPGYPLRQGPEHGDVTDMWAMRKQGWCPNAWSSNMTCTINHAWTENELLSYLSMYANTASC